MEIIVGKTAGFCFGIANAVTKAEKQAESGETIYCLGELAHNSEVIKELENKGINFIENIKDAKNKLIIRAHGVAEDIYEQAKEKNIELIDLTCPKILKIHNLAKEYSNKGYYIFLIGQFKHPETIGTISYCGKAANIIEDIQDLEESVAQLNKSGKKDLVVICQTTIKLEKFNDIIDNLKNRLSQDINFEIINTICQATRDRQKETIEIAKEVDLMVIIGGKNSSNTKKLYELSNKYCKNSICVETKEELKAENLNNFNKIGIMAGASTPKKSIEEIYEILKQL